MAGYMIETQGLTKKFGKSIGIENVDMHVKKGEIYGLVGKNGAGKTTIMKLLCGIISPTEGKMTILGKEFTNTVAGVGERIGNILETPAFFPYLSARDNLEYYRKQKGIPDKQKVDEILKYVGLENAGKKTFKQFSLGMKQRLGFAYALLGEPDILILDEPTNGLDPQGIIHFRETIKKLAREKQITVIISTHILSELSQLATVYGFIKNGHLVQEISAGEVAESCKHHLLIHVNEPLVAATILEEKFKTRNFEVIQNKGIKLFEYLDRAAEINEALVLGGAYVTGLQEVKGNLEEYYMNVMGDEKNA